MKTYTFVFDQPQNEDMDQPHFVVSEGGSDQEAEMQARDYLWETTETTRGFRRTMIFQGMPLTPADTDGGRWIDARLDQAP